MLELVMRAFHARQKPAFCFQSLDDLLAVHGGCYTHHDKSVNTITTTWAPLKTHDFRADDARNRGRVLVAPIF
jgi:hypothetical protein